MKDKIENMFIPIKIISSDNTHLITNIIKATNRQTPVPEETFIVLSNFHKNIQLFFNQYQGKLPINIVYERRNGEYSNTNELKYKINLHTLIRTVTCVFLQEPNLVYSNNPANILKSKSNILFSNITPIEIYFISAYLFSYLQKLYTEEILGKYDNSNKYYVIMVVYILLSKNKAKRDFESKEFHKEIEDVLQQFKSRDLKKDFLNASNFVSEIIDQYKKDKSYIPDSGIRKLVDFNDFLFESLTDSFINEV